MARVSTDGIKELADRLAAAEKRNKGTLERIITVGAEKMAESIKQSALQKGLKKSGKLVDSIKMITPKVGADDGWAFTEVYPQGKRANGKGKPKRNATIGFVQEYGRQYTRKNRTVRKREPTWFVDEAEKNGAEAATEAMARFWREAEDI